MVKNLVLLMPTIIYRIIRIIPAIELVTVTVKYKKFEKIKAIVQKRSRVADAMAEVQLTPFMRC